MIITGSSKPVCCDLATDIDRIAVEDNSLCIYRGGSKTCYPLEGLARPINGSECKSIRLNPGQSFILDPQSNFLYLRVREDNPLYWKFSAFDDIQYKSARFEWNMSGLIENYPMGGLQAYRPIIEWSSTGEVKYAGRKFNLVWADINGTVINGQELSDWRSFGGLSWSDLSPERLSSDRVVDNFVIDQNIRLEFQPGPEQTWYLNPNPVDDANKSLYAGYVKLNLKGASHTITIEFDISINYLNEVTISNANVKLDGRHYGTADFTSIQATAVVNGNDLYVEIGPEILQLSFVERYRKAYKHIVLASSDEELIDPIKLFNPNGDSLTIDIFTATTENSIGYHSEDCGCGCQQQTQDNVQVVAHIG